MLYQLPREGELYRGKVTREIVHLMDIFLGCATKHKMGILPIFTRRGNEEKRDK